MKKRLALLALLSSLVIVPVNAEQTMGIGGVVGAPTGFSLNLFTTNDQSIHTVVGWSLLDDDTEEEMVLFSHYTWRRQASEDKGAGWFYGLGGRLEWLDENDVTNNPDGDEFQLGPSATLGFLYGFDPLELFIKGNGTLNVVEETEFEADAMVGAHLNF